MKSAEEILMSSYQKIIEENKLSLTVKEIMGVKSHSIIVEAINEARKEAIEECADVSSKYVISPVGTASHIKNKILSLIKELK